MYYVQKQPLIFEDKFPFLTSVIQTRAISWQKVLENFDGQQKKQLQPVQFFVQPSSCIALVYQLVCSRTIAGQLQYDCIAEFFWTGTSRNSKGKGLQISILSHVFIVYPSKFFSALRSYCPRLSVVLLSYDCRSTLKRLDHRIFLLEQGYVCFPFVLTYPVCNGQGSYLFSFLHLCTESIAWKRIQTSRPFLLTAVRRRRRRQQTTGKRGRYFLWEKRQGEYMKLDSITRPKKICVCCRMSFNSLPYDTLSTLIQLDRRKKSRRILWHGALHIFFWGGMFLKLPAGVEPVRAMAFSHLPVQIFAILSYCNLIAIGRQQIDGCARAL